MGEKEISVIEIPDLLDFIWENRPEIPSNPVFELEAKYAGLSRLEKQKLLAEKLISKGASVHIVSMLDELAWLHNLRGSDIQYNPVFTGFGLVSEKENLLFVDKAKLTTEQLQTLEKDGIVVKDYDSFHDFLSQRKRKNNIY